MKIFNVRLLVELVLDPAFYDNLSEAFFVSTSEGYFGQYIFPNKLAFGAVYRIGNDGWKYVWLMDMLIHRSTISHLRN